MDLAYYQDEFKKERRARLAAERLLEQKQSQLQAANRKLSQHAINLSGQIVDQRKTLDKLQGENSQATAQSLKATHKALAAERLLWDAVKSIQDGFALFDKDRKLISANAPYLDLFRSAQNVGPGISMESILELCIEGDLVDRGAKSDDEWYDYMLDRLTVDEIAPVTLKLHNGIYVKLVDRRTSDGGIVSLALNITDTIRREQELVRARDKAMAADRAKSAFLAKMSHEFRTPINGIVGMAELLLDHSDDEESQLYATTIKNSGQSLLGFVNNVLEYATIEADRQELTIAPFEVSDLLEGVKKAMDAQEIPQGVQVVFETDPHIPQRLLGDADRVGQIIKNLFTNAIQHTEAGSVMVRTLWTQSGDNSELVVAVEDTGAGIPEDKLDHIFGDFNQTDDSHSRSKDGAGLGLTIVQKLVETMGGDLSIVSVEGKGSHFQVTIPISSSDPLNQSPKKSTPDGLALLISQDTLVHAAMTRAFIACGIEYDEAERLPEVLDDEVSVIFADPAQVASIKAAAPHLRVVSFGTGPDCIEGPYRSADILAAWVPVDPIPAMTPETSAQPAVIAKLRVLAAEDNKTNQLVFSKMVKDADIDLKMVGDGLAAVEEFKAFEPHLIFMDISMPKMDGMEATQQIRWHEAENGFEPIPIVAMTAHAMEGDEARIRNCGLDHYLTKPLSKTAILEMIATVKSDLGVGPSAEQAS